MEVRFGDTALKFKSLIIKLLPSGKVLVVPEGTGLHCLRAAAARARIFLAIFSAVVLWLYTYAGGIIWAHEADGPVLEGRPTEEAAKAIRKDWRSGGGTHPACD